MAITKGKPEAATETPHRRTAYRFGEYILDGGGLFRCDGAGLQTPVTLGSRALEVLTILVRHAGELVSKRTLIETVWPHTVVEDSNLAVQISALRRILDFRNPDASCIRTITGRGYRFVAKVNARTSPNPAADEMPLKIVSPPTRRLSIIVLPLKWHGDDANGGDIAERITDALAIELGKLPCATVIAYETARWYQASPVNLRAIREDLHVRYAVEGSIGGIVDKLHVSIRLVSTESGTQLWADRFEQPR